MAAKPGGKFQKGTGERTKAQLAAPPLVARKGNMGQKVTNASPRRVSSKGK